MTAICLALLTACSGDGSAGSRPAGADTAAFTVFVDVSSEGCSPQPATVPAGTLVFWLTGDQSRAVQWVGLARQAQSGKSTDQWRFGETQGDFTLRLSPGGYQLSCPGARQTTWPLSVVAPFGPQLTQAVAAYHDYVVGQVQQLAAATTALNSALVAGDVGAAQRLYASAHTLYRTIEPVAERVGNLDADIDGGGEADSARWMGFHRIEQALWDGASLDGMAPVSDQLSEDVAALLARVAITSYEPAQVAMNAAEALHDLVATIAAGDEEPYSHTDLWDIAGAVQGAEQAFTLLEPALTPAHSALTGEIRAQFQMLDGIVARYRSGDGYVMYAGVDARSREALSGQARSLSALLSQIPPLLFDGP